MVADLRDQLDPKLVEAWTKAATELGIRVTAPVAIGDADGSEVACEALVHDFGSPTGAIIVSPRTRRRLRSEGRDALVGRYVAVEPRSRFKRERIIETLLDLGWFGSNAAPDWYRRRERS